MTDPERWNFETTYDTVEFRIRVRFEHATTDEKGLLERLTRKLKAALFLFVDDIEVVEMAEARTQVAPRDKWKRVPIVEER